VPLGFFFFFAVFARPLFCRGYREIDDRPPLRGVAKFGVSPEIADENNFVNARHGEHPPNTLNGSLMEGE
jgi:hypothetical protein